MEALHSLAFLGRPAVEGQGQLDSNDIKVMGSCHPLEPKGKGHGWQLRMEQARPCFLRSLSPEQLPADDGVQLHSQDGAVMETPALCPLLRLGVSVTYPVTAVCCLDSVCGLFVIRGSFPIDF